MDEQASNGPQHPRTRRGSGGLKLADVATLAETGIANAESGSWIALLAPAGTRGAVIDKISADVKEVLAGAELHQALMAQGATPRGTTPAELHKTIDSDRERYARVIQARKVKLD